MFTSKTFRNFIIMLFMAQFLTVSTVSFADTVIYSYDDLNRLKQANFGNGTAIAYDYDEVGNITQRNISVPGTVVINTIARGCGAVNKPAGDPLFVPGSSPVYSFLANTGAYLADVAVDGVSLGNIPSYTFSNVAANHALAVDFVVPDGDVNIDGVVTAADADLALRLAVGLDPLTRLALAHGDVSPLVNGAPSLDGIINVFDALLIDRKASGLESWNTSCSTTQGFAATKLASASATTLNVTTSSTDTKQVSSCREYFNLFDESTLLNILNMLHNADQKGKDVVVYNDHVIVTKKISKCELSMEIYSDAKQKNLLCRESGVVCSN